MPQEETDTAAARIEDVYRRYGLRAYAVTRRMLGNDRDAESATREVLLQTVCAPDARRGDAAEKVLVYRRIVIAARSVRRKRTSARDRRVGAAAGAGCGGICASTGNPCNIFSSGADRLAGAVRCRTEAAIARLSEVYRDPLILRDVEHLRYRRIARLLGINVLAVRGRVRLARRMVQNSLRAYFESRYMVGVSVRLGRPQ
jgi:RNA polymerase sigma-70 factor (ECF subfamily)